MKATQSPDRPNLLDTIDSTFDESRQTSQDYSQDSLACSPVQALKPIINLISSDDDSFQSPIIQTRRDQLRDQIWDS